MMRIAFLFISFLFLCVVGVFGSKYATAIGLSDSAKNYYSLRNAAERDVINMDFKSALDKYQAAFLYKYPNERDIYNAFRTAVLIQDSVRAKEYFNIITINGQSREKFENTPFIKKIKGSSLYRFASQDYDSLYPRILPDEKLAYIKALDSIYFMDQAIRKDNVLTGEEKIQSVKTTDSINAALLIKLIKTFGYPTYQRVGIFEKFKYGFGPGDGTIDLVFWHIWRTGNFCKDLNEVVADAVAKGDCVPEDYAFYMDGQSEKKIYYSVLPKDVNGDFSTDEITEIGAVNQFRKDVGLYPLSELKARIEFHKDHKEDPMLGFLFLSFYNHMVNLMPPGFTY